MEDPVVKEVILIVPSDDDSYEVVEHIARNVNVALIKKVFGDVNITHWSPDPPEILKEKLSIIDFAPKLEEGQKYILSSMRSLDWNLEQRLRTLERYRWNSQNFLEGAAAEHAVKLLEEKGYTNVQRYCGLKAGSNFDIDAAAVSDEACILVECKNNIDQQAMKQLEATYNLLKSSTHEDFAPFRDRPVFRMMAGSVGGNAKVQGKVHDLLAKNGIGVLLASRHSLAIGNGCVGRESYVPTKDVLLKTLGHVRRYIAMLKR